MITEERSTWMYLMSLSTRTNVQMAFWHFWPVFKLQLISFLLNHKICLSSIISPSKPYVYRYQESQLISQEHCGWTASDVLFNYLEQEELKVATTISGHCWMKLIDGCSPSVLLAKFLQHLSLNQRPSMFLRARTTLLAYIFSLKALSYPNFVEKSLLNQWKM